MAWAQTPTRPAASARPDTAVTLSGSADSARVGVGGRKGDIETTVKYQAKDSIRFNVQEKVAVLYNKASVNYGELDLKAAVITVDYSRNLLTAEGAKDSTGRMRDRPVFKNGAETYQAGRIAYNFKTRKGKISEAVTQQGEGYIHAEVVKKNELNEIFGRNGQYTTCNLAHPHFYISSSKMKVIPGEKVISGPFNLVVGDIPTPLGFLFGYFPTPGKSRASGVIIPTFGQAIDRGFYLSNGGYYWAINEYMGLRVTGDVYSGNADAFGGWALNTDLTYRKRYAYDGRLDFRYSRRPASPLLRSTDLNASPNLRRNFKPRTFWLTWTHSPTPRPGGGRFSASVRTGSPEFNNQNSLDVRNYLTPAFNSSISYQKQLRNLPVNYSIQAMQDLNTITGTVNLTLPDITVGVQRQYLFELLGLPSRGAWYEQLAVAYQLTGQNRLSNVEPARNLSSGIPLLGGVSTQRTIPVRLNNLSPLLRNGQTSLQHRFDIALGSYTLLRHLAFTPSVNYSESWYFKRLDYKYVEAARAVRIDTIRELSRVYNYSGGASLQTNIYGLLPIKGKKIEAIRHRMAPSVGFTYSPNFLRQEQFYDPDIARSGLINPTTGLPYLPSDFSRYQGFTAGTPGGAEAGLISFSLSNQVEMKVRNSADTTGTQPFRKVSLIDGLDFGTSYDIAADSIRLQPLQASFRTQVAQKLSILVSSRFNFYQRDSTGLLIDRFLLDQPNRRLARMENAGVQLSYQFDSNRRSGQPANRRQRVAPTNDPVLGNPNQPDAYVDYVDFSVPWTLNASLTANYQTLSPRVPRPGEARQRSWNAVSLNASGEVKLTDKMRISYSTGYDFISNKITISQINFFRDLHCWQIIGSWTPNGQIQGFNVTIGAKSSLLQDLKLNRNRTFQNR